MLAKNLAYLLRGDRFAQANLAEKVGVTQPTISKWSRMEQTGSTAEPEFRKIAKLARVVGVSLDDLAWRDVSSISSGSKSQPVGRDDANMAQAVELLHMLAELRPDDARFRRISWHAIQVTAKAIAKAEGSQKDAVRMILEELTEGV